MKLMKMLPSVVYTDEEHVQDFQNALEVVLHDAQDARDKLFLQLRPSTATWGLDFFEHDFGIIPDPKKPTDQRLQMLRAKRRGKGTTTKEMIQRIAHSFTNTQVEVLEYPEDYRFVIKFTDHLGVPPNAADLEKIIAEIKPAHLGFELVFLYHTHLELLRYTHDELGDFSHLHLREKSLPEWVRHNLLASQRHGDLNGFTHFELRRGLLHPLTTHAQLMPYLHQALEIYSGWELRRGWMDPLNPYEIISTGTHGQRLGQRHFALRRAKN